MNSSKKAVAARNKKLNLEGESVVVGISQPAFFHYRQLGEDDFIIGEITYYPNSKILVKIE